MVHLSARLLSLPAPLRRLLLTTTQQQQPSIPQYVNGTICTQRSHSTQTPPHGGPSPSSSVNATEVSHFTSLASEWWDPQGSSRLLHLMNPLRHRFLQDCISPTAAAAAAPDKLKVLDIGCGGGIFAESAARLPSVGSVTGLDPTQACVQVARTHARTDPALLSESRLRYVNASIEDFVAEQAAKPAGQADAFDIITVFEVLEHIRQPSPFLLTALGLLKPGGWLVGSTIARAWTSWLTTKLVAEDVLGLVPRGTHEWSQYINPEELQGWVEKEGSSKGGLVAESWRCQGVVYVPAVGWREVQGSEGYGNYFFGVQKRSV
ncbi:hexaprenyldihydroxybenzoate methyltransferase mitochondrial precursor [Polychaeton citri CBS 116435]|uniref:Ubiquinone biosynthesis O-methyltransferase, mitochondrial n=1 Tax=Polychaeton citri CBS 116435 TaxID=1314669 RepID=A0A9P4PYF2_9PEZI|nr:hexaprenyldihydroxybenzoate methyltransferase mitochondrial precursor [Polychaeton citri CBS 116435]